MKGCLFEIWFSLRCGAANREFQPLLEIFGTPYEIFNASASELEDLPCSQNLKNRLMDKSLGEATRIMEYCEANDVEILFWQSEQYPTILRSLMDPPVLLYCKGTLPAMSEKLCISVVGTRSMSEYGKRMAYKIGYELAAAGTVVVSGMALGNDSVAAAGAIAAGGQTVAVLGCGIDIIYPREHTKLYDEILKRGAILTEYPPATPPEGRNFPVRNRLISGLSRGTVVIEGDLRSGSMITARTAILQGRNVYAIGGSEQSAKLMGLPVGRTKVAVYAINGFCSALAGIAYLLMVKSGWNMALQGGELEVISCAVIGGTLLTGGVGYMIGTMFGVLLKSVIPALISFNGNLSSWWGKIATGALLLLFIVIQRAVVSYTGRNKR